MEQMTTTRNRQDGCALCLLKLGLIQAQVEKVEKMLYCIKDTLNFKEACLYTGLSSSQLYKLTKNGGIPHYKPNGKLLFYSRRELEGWLCRNHADADTCTCEMEGCNTQLNEIQL